MRATDLTDPETRGRVPTGWCPPGGRQLSNPPADRGVSRLRRGHRCSSRAAQLDPAYGLPCLRVGIDLERAHRMDLPTGHVSQGPPTIPDGRISRVRFWPRLCTPFLRAGLPPRRETAVLAHPSPRRGGVCIAPSPRRRHRRIQLCVRVRTNCRGHRVPRAPLPGAGVTRAGTASRPPGGALPPRRRSYGLMRQTTALPRLG